MVDKPDIYIMSDLHFDTKRLPGYVKKKLSKLAELGDLEGLKAYQCEVDNNPHYHYSKAQIELNVKLIVSVLNKNKTDNIFILAGDFFNDLFKTLDFISLLEELKIVSFVVLGNHDYWTYSGNKLILKQSIEIASKETENNQYCRLLLTGRKYLVNGLTFIGDSGFTNLHYPSSLWVDNDGKRHTERITTTEVLQKITPDAFQIKDFDADVVQELNEKWSDFAKQEIKKQSKKAPLFIVTHWPMDQRADDEVSSWWQTDAGFPKDATANSQVGEKYWMISGHTHRDIHEANSIATQAGYNTETWFEKFSLSQFGQLVPNEKMYGLIDIHDALARFRDPSIISSTGNEEVIKSESRKISLQGYRRAGSWGNKKVLSAYLKSPQRYINSVKRKIGKIKNIFVGNVGYSDVEGPNLYQAKIYVKEAIEILKMGYDHNPFEFFTALVVTGYAYNDCVFRLNQMRKVTTYDIIRQSMVYQTIMSKDDLKISKIETVVGLRGSHSVIDIANMKLRIPVVNDYHLPLSAFQVLATEFNGPLLGDKEAEEKRLALKEETDQIAKREQARLDREKRLLKNQEPKKETEFRFSPLKKQKCQSYPHGTRIEDLSNTRELKGKNGFHYQVNKTIKGEQYKKNFTTLDEAIDYLNQINKPFM